MSLRAFHQGIWLRLLAAFLMVAMSALVHQAAAVAPVGQIMFWRSAMALLPIVLFMQARRTFPRALRTRHPRLHLTRSLFGAFSMGLSFLSLAYLPVANAQAIAYLAPVLTVPFAALLLHERIGKTLMAAVGIGFAGVIALLWDALALPGEGAVFGIAAGLAYALTMAFVRVYTKHMTATESPSTIAFYFALVSCGVGLATLPFGWAELSWGQWSLLAAAGVIGGLGHIASNEAVARASVSALAPFDFTGLIWALLFDILLFGHLPGVMALAGCAAITLAAVLVVFDKPGARGGERSLRRE